MAEALFSAIREDLFSQTSARFGVAAAQKVPHDRNAPPAVTLTHPGRPSIRAWSALNNDQTREPLSGMIYDFHGISVEAA
jgi:hypothetical protein